MANPIKTRDEQDSFYQGIFSNAGLQHHYASRVGLSSSSDTASQPFPDVTSFYDDHSSTEPKASSRGERMVQAARRKTRAKSSFHDLLNSGERTSGSSRLPHMTVSFSGNTYRRSQRLRDSNSGAADSTFPGYVLTRPHAKSVVSSGDRVVANRESAARSSTVDEVKAVEDDGHRKESGIHLARTRRRQREGDDDDTDDDFDWTQITDGALLLEYPKDSPRRHAVTGRDLLTLTPGHFLNDSIIDFYLNYLGTEGLSAEIRSRVYFFSCFFFKRLVDDDGKGDVDDAMRHNRVKNWTKNVDLFSNDFIVIPVNKGAHWFLVVVCYAGEALNAASATTDAIPAEPLTHHPCILILDSLGIKRPLAKSCAKTIGSYLVEEFKQKRGAEVLPESANLAKFMPWFAPRVPLQPNGSDCGIYVLHFAEKFLQNPFVDGADEELGSDRSAWFPSSEATGKRKSIRDLILVLGGFRSSLF